MDSKIERCRSCGNELKADKLCPECTLTDLKISDTLVESVIERQERPLPFQAFLIESGSQATLPIPGPKCKIGRDPINQIVIKEDQYTSRFHAWITFEEGHFFVEDLGSTNGTLLNGSPLINRRPLVNGDRVRIGRSEFIFHLNGSGLAIRASQSSRSI